MNAMKTRTSHAVAVLAALVLSFAGCRCSKEQAVPVEATPAKDGSYRLMIEGRTVELAADSVFGAKAPVTASTYDDRRVFLLRSSESPTPGTRTYAIYFVGDGAFISPAIDATARPPPLDDALGDLFDAAGSRRNDLVRAVAKDKGDAGVARMLGDAAHVDDRAWDDAFAVLSPAAVAEVDRRLADALEPGKPARAIRRAVIRVDLRAPDKAKAIAARARDLLEPMREPRANAVLVRALARSDPSAAAALACEALAKKPAGISADDREILVEASALALAHAGAVCDDAPSLLDEILLRDPCRAYFRCAADGPLSPRTTTKQDEPLCSKQQLAGTIAKELDRTPADVLAAAEGTRSALFAYAALASKDKLPPPFAVAHARRRYTLTQPDEPVCEAELGPGVPCHCDEALVRDQTCRRSSGGESVHVSTCRFEIDDAKKRIVNVVSASAP